MLQTRDFFVVGKSASGTITFTYILRVTENSISVENNTSNMTVEAILKQTYSGTTFSSWSTGVSCTVNGSQLFSDYRQRAISGTQEHVYHTWTGDLAHQADGSLTITVGGRLWQNSASNYTPPTLNIPEGTMELTRIPRASAAGASDVVIGGRSTIVITRATDSFTHVLGYDFAGSTGYIGADGQVTGDPVHLSGSTVSFLIPESFYGLIPNAPYGDCTLKCDTYSGGTHIGTHTSTFRITAEESRCRPSVSGSVEDINPATVALTGDPAVLVRYQSTARCVLTAQANWGASIVERKIAGLAVSDPVLELPCVEAGSISFFAKDSRDYSVTVQMEQPVIPYVKLTNNARAARTFPTTGQAQLQFEGYCYYGSFGAANNRLSGKYRIRPEDGSFGDWQTMELRHNEDHTYWGQVDLTELDYTKSYVFETEVTDALETVNKTLILQQGIPVFHWVRDQFNFHVPVTAPMMNSLSVQSIRFDTNTTVTMPVSGRGIALIGVMANSSSWGLYVVTNWEPIPTTISAVTRIAGDLELNFSMEEGAMVIHCPYQWSYGWYIRNIARG